MVACRTGVRAAVSALTAAALLGLATPAAAQRAGAETHRVAASVDYVSMDGLYLGVGSDHGATAGDTVSIFVDSIAVVPLGRIVLTSVSRRRSVARPLGISTELESGMSLSIELPIPRASSDTSSTASRETSAANASPPRATSAARGATGLRLSGRVSVDLDARETRTSWSGELFGEAVRRFATPTTRLSLLASGLPGNVTMRVNLRASYRYDELTDGPAPLSVRAYELAAVRSFDALPLQIMLGRFASPYESYSAYWDGALVRIGGDTGPGIGVAAGFEPRLHDEGFSTALPKLTAFADFAVHGRSWRYDTDLSAHWFRRDAVLDVRSAGWSQRLSLGPFDLAQRLRVNRGNSGGWSIGDARVRAAVDVFGPLRLRATYGRLRAVPGVEREWTDTVALDAGPVREEASVGVEIDGRRAAMSLDAGGMRHDGGSPGSSLSMSGRLGWDAGGVGLSGRRWSRAGTETWSLTPSLDAAIGGMSWRVSYRFYRTDTAASTLTTHAAGGDVRFVLARALHFTVGGDRQWGGSLSGARVHFGVWRGF